MKIEKLHKVLFPICMSIFLAACGGSDGKKDPEKENGMRSIKDMTIDERERSVILALENLEKNGYLPDLDRQVSTSGDDLNENGIRDDIELYIYDKAYTEDDRILLKIFARSLQSIQTSDLIDREFARSVYEKMSAVRQCINNKASDAQRIRNLTKNLTAFTANTKIRMNRMGEYESKIFSGTLPRVDCDSISFENNEWINPAYSYITNKNSVINQTCFQKEMPPRDKMALAFFNGVKNTEDDANDSLRETIKVITEKGKSWDIDSNYYSQDIFYNDSYGLFKDVIEVFRQRAASKGLSPEAEVLIKNHPELIPLLRDPSGNPNSYEFKKHLDNFEFFTFVNSFHALQAEFGNHGDELNEIYADHRAKIEKWKNENRKMILVAHSQGNLFVNKAYEAALEMGVSPDDIKVVHVAPASLKRYGDYILADVDTIIRPLLNTPPVNAYNGYPRVFDDPTGHGYIETYLNRDLDSGRKTIDAIVNAYSSVSDYSQILDYSQDEINKLFYPKIYPNPSMELFRFYATSDSWTNDINVDVKEYSDDLLIPNESKSDYANNVYSVNDSLSGGDILAVECKVDDGIQYVTWDFEINFKYKGDLESVSQVFLVSIKHENYSGDLFRESVFKDVGIEGDRPTYTLRASVSAEIIPTDLEGQYRVKLKGRDGETETIVRKYYE